MAIEIDQVYAQIDEQRAVLIGLLNTSAKNPIAPNRLSDACMKLAVLNELLGGFVAQLKATQLDKEKELYVIAKEAKASDTGANAQARLFSGPERAAYERADMKHTDIWKLISMAQTHIRAEGDERRAG